MAVEPSEGGMACRACSYLDVGSRDDQCVHHLDSEALFHLACVDVRLDSVVLFHLACVVLFHLAWLDVFHLDELVECHLA